MTLSYSSAPDQESPPSITMKNGLRFILAPVPLPVIQFFLTRIIKSISQNRPEIYARIGPHQNKLFLIDPTNCPFVILLKPDKHFPLLKAMRRRADLACDARIKGSFFTLLGMIDGRYDGDALFFTRDLQIEGDTEAVVCLRNALDNIDGSVAEDIAGMFGTPGAKILNIIRKMSDHAKKS